MMRNEPLTWVGVTGFEPAASSSRTKRATKLRHTPPDCPRSLADPGYQREQRSLRPAEEPNRGIGRGAETSGDMQPGPVLTVLTWVFVQAADHAPGDAAVRDESADAGKAHLPAGGVPGQQQVEAVGGELVEYRGLRRVQDAQAQVGGRVGDTGDLAVPVPGDMGVVHAGHFDVAIGYLQAATVVVGVEPAGAFHPGAQFGPRQVGHVPAVLVRAGTPQVPGGILRHWRVQVVRSVDEYARSVQQRPERGQERGYRLRMRDRVAGVDDQVGLEGVQRA